MATTTCRNLGTRAGKWFFHSFALSLSVLCISLPPLASAQPGPTPTPGAVDPDANKHEFNRGESIYDAPDSLRLLKFSIVNRNKAVMDELAALVVEYQALDGQEKKGHVDEAKRRELGLRKVQFYNKYNLGAAILKVPKSKMPAYLAFWPNFWKRVDQFQKENPGLEGPGPFQLPRESRMSALRDGAISVAQGVGDLVRVREAAAAVGKVEQKAPRSLLTDDYPRCSELYPGRAVPILLCEPGDDRSFYYERESKRNFREVSSKFVPENTYTHRITRYKDNHVCKWDPREKRRVLTGAIYRDSVDELSYCGTNAGDNAGQRTKTTEVNYTREVSDFKEGTIHYGTYCMDRASDPETFRRYQEVWAQEVKLEKEPEWICN